MSVSVTSRRLSDGHQPQPPLPHAVTPPSPDASKVSHGPFSSSSSPSSSPQQTLPQRRPSKPVEEQKQAEPHLISRLSTSNASSSVYSSSSLSSSVQQHYQHSLPDTSHHSVVSFAPLPAVAAVHSSLFPVTHLAADAHNNPTASTASHSSTNSYLPAAHPAHPHSDTEDDVDEEEEVEEAGEGEEGEYEDEEESVGRQPARRPHTDIRRRARRPTMQLLRVRPNRCPERHAATGEAVRAGQWEQ